MTDENLSPIAARVKSLPAPPRAAPLFGLVVHCSPRSWGVPPGAPAADGRAALGRLVDYYARARNSTHYVVGYEGQLVQVHADDERVSHVGSQPGERELYLSGEWRHRVTTSALQLWDARWGDEHTSPQALFPGKYPNTCYAGVELLPHATSDDRLWYTDEQHVAVARLADDLRERHGWPAWPLQLPCPRLLGHEDLRPLRRWDRRGGWDPGALRPEPRFDWAAVSLVLRSG